MIGFFIIGGILLVVMIFVIAIYNKLIRLRNTVKSSWSDIDVHLKKRYDLVPNLVETVKGYASHEKSVLENVTEARAVAMKASTPADKAKAENIFRETLECVFNYWAQIFFYLGIIHMEIFADENHFCIQFTLLNQFLNFVF